MSRKVKIMERMEEEMAVYKKELEAMDKKDLIENISTLSCKLHIWETGQAYIENALDNGIANKAVYERLDHILDSFYTFQLGSMDGAITEETIEEFETEMKLELIAKANSKQASKNPVKKQAVKPTYLYRDLSEDAKKVAYEDALRYIEEEYYNNDEILSEKEKHARDEAENCGRYFADGTVAMVI